MSRRGSYELKRGEEGGRGVVFSDNRVLQLLEMEVGFFSISCRFKNCEDGFCWSFIGDYEPTLKMDREVFWSEMGVDSGLWSDPWCVVDNFNMIRFPLERSRGSKLSLSMRRFSEVIEDLELRDLPF